MKRESPSSRGRGLKSPNLSDTLPSPYVALFTRAWIEIYSYKSKLYQTYVALFTRAWIEIVIPHIIISAVCCRPLHEGVDWNQIYDKLTEMRASRPLHEGVDWNCRNMLTIYTTSTSPSSRGRGLKYIPSSEIYIATLVALFTRAWIEIVNTADLH